MIDGKLDDAAWRQAGIVDDFRIVPGEETATKYPVTAMVGYDESNLYIAARCKETSLEKLRAVAKQASDMVFQDDSLEIFVDRGYTRATYYHFIVNANGVVYVGYGWARKDGVAVNCKAGREKDAWTLEMAIPWAQIGAKPPEPGEKIGFNIVHNHVADDPEGATWSPLHGNLNHSPQYFGTLYAGNSLPREAVAMAAGHAFVKDMSKVAMTLDGSLDKWRGVKPLKIMDGTNPVADLYLGWKPDGLYAAFDVTSKAPWKNAAAFEMAFNGGAACDLNLGPLGERHATVPGDVRFIAAPINGTAQVVEFLPQLTADLSGADKAPRSYHTDAQGDNPFARVAVLPAGASVAKVKPDGSGYIVEMRVPLRAPLKLTLGLRCKFDASLILANPDGTLATLRLPWFSTSGDDMFVATDRVMETRLRPWNWGEAELE